MSEAARLRRDDARYEPQLSVPGREPAPREASDPLAELARLVGQDDPFRNVFRQASVPPGPVEQGHVAHPDHHGHDEAYAEAAHHGHDGYEDVAHAEGYPQEDGHYGDVDGYHHGAAHHDEHGAYHHDDHYAADGAQTYADDAGLADERFAPDHAAAPVLPDMWARGEQGVPGAAPEIDQGFAPAGLGPPGKSSARRPVAVMAAVLLLTGGGLAASFLAKGSSTLGVASAGASRSAPTILAATGPTKVKVNDGSATAPEDQDAALLNKTGNLSSGPVKIVSSQEQPADLAQLPKSDLADGARPLPPPSASPFPEPKKVKTFLVHPDGTMLAPNGAPASAGQVATTGSVPAVNDAASAATPKTVAHGGTTPKNPAPSVSIATLSADPSLADPAAATSEAKPARQPASPGVHAPAAKPNDTAEAASAGAGGYGLQLASSPAEAEANAAFAKLKKKYPAQLGALTATVHKADTGDKPVYRVRVGGMGQDEAKALCAQLQGAGGSCFVVHN